MSATVSVIVPVYNCKDYLPHCLQSISDQTYAALEVIVVDDGSSDGSSVIIDDYVNMDTRFIAVHEKNSGVCAARNAAVEKAAGKYLLFVDSDDFIGRDYIKNLVEAAEKNGSEMVFCGFSNYSGGRTVSSVTPASYVCGKDEIWAYRISMAACRLYLRDFWMRNHLHFISEPGSRGEDIPIAMFANAAAKNISFVPSADYYYVKRAGSATNSGRKVLFQFPYKAFEACYNAVIRDGRLKNSRETFLIGTAKALAQFEYVIYRKADPKTRKKFSGYVRKLLAGNTAEIKAVWKKSRRTIDLPFSHKIAITLFVHKYC